MKNNMLLVQTICNKCKKPMLKEFGEKSNICENCEDLEICYICKKEFNLANKDNSGFRRMRDGNIKPICACCLEDELI